MKRSKAIECWDKLIGLGYVATILGQDMQNYVDPATGSSLRYSVHINEISVDKVDLKVLVELADELGLDAGLSMVRGNGSISFGDPERTPAIVSARRHPR